MFSTRDKVLLALARAPRRRLSGTALARRFGLTRASVWKQMKALKADGFLIKTNKTQGYQLTTPFDVSLLQRPTRRTSFWKRHYYFSLPSTQLLTKKAADSGAAEGNYWLAEKQTAGRGRLDRFWDSSLGGLWLSLLLRPKITPPRVPSLTLVVALTWAETIQDVLGLPARLKWPNDVMVQTPSGWRKVGGILTDMSAEMDRTHWVVVGMGINVNNKLPSNLTHRAVALADLCNKQLSRDQLLNSFLSRFGKAYKRFEKSGFEVFRKPYWKYYSRPHELVEILTVDGSIQGKALDVDALGALVVESHKQIRSIWEGEIVI